MAAPLPPLLRRSPLLLGESLPSLLVRLGRLNFYEPVTLIYEICREILGPLSNERLGRSIAAADYERLAALTGEHPYDLYRATVHRFAPLFTSPGNDMPVITVAGTPVPLLRPTVAAHYLHTPATTHVCPRCVHEAPYHRLCWLVQRVIVCPYHRCVLHSFCPQCGKNMEVRSVVQARCHYCATDLTTLPTLSVADDPLGVAYATVLNAWLTDEPTPAPARYGLPDQPSWALLRVLDVLVDAVIGCGNGWSYWHYAPGVDRWHPDERRLRPTMVSAYRLYTTAFRGLMDWPHGFFEFLSAYRTRTAKGTLDAVEDHLGAIVNAGVEWLIHTFGESRRMQHPLTE